MATMDNAAIAEAKRKIAPRMLRLTLWKRRDMPPTWTHPRRLRLPKQARALKSLIREAQAVGLVPPPSPPPQARRRARPR